MTRPLIKWPGGKRRLAPAIAEALGPARGAYVEPFVGGAAVYLHQRAGARAREYRISDINRRLIGMYLAVRHAPEEVIGALEGMPRDGWRERYYEVREAFNAGPFEGPEHAARLLWLNRTGFNGLYRENRRGEYNVAVGRHRGGPDWHTPDHIRQVSAALQGADIRCRDYSEALAEVGEGDRVYCDPPYLPVSATADFRAYSAGGFGLDAQAGLARACEAAAARGAVVVLSQADVAAAGELYPESAGWEVVARLEVPRRISRSGGSRGRAGELVLRVGGGS